MSKEGALDLDIPAQKIIQWLVSKLIYFIGIDTNHHPRIIPSLCNEFRPPPLRSFYPLFLVLVVSINFIY